MGEAALHRFIAPEAPRLSPRPLAGEGGPEIAEGPGEGRDSGEGKNPSSAFGTSRLLRSRRQADTAMADDSTQKTQQPRTQHQKPSRHGFAGVPFMSGRGGVGLGGGESARARAGRTRRRVRSAPRMPYFSLARIAAAAAQHGRGGRDRQRAAAPK